MSNWITLSGADVRLLDDERSQIDGLTLTTTLDAIVEAAANLARGYVGRRFSLAAAPQIPAEVKNAVLAIAAADYISQAEAIGVPNLLSDSRKTARDNAYKLLKDIAAGNFVITPSDDAVSQSGAPVMETVQAGNSGNSREDLSRL